MATHQKKVARLCAHLVFIDESGFNLMPNVRRTWALRGDTPVLGVPTSARRQRLSAIAALTVSPRRKRVGLVLQTHKNRSVRQEQVIVFLRELLKRLRGPIVIVWDNIGTHRSVAVRAFLAKHPRLHVESLPAYAPELNPVEWYWCDSKHHRLANHGFRDFARLIEAVKEHHAEARQDQRRLRGYVRSAQLPWRLWPTHG